MVLFKFQALRYSYFHVGQVLGAPQQIQDQGQSQPLQLRPIPPPHIPPLTLPGTTHQPQHHPVPPNRPGKAELKPDRAAQSRFPIIHDKGLQSMVSSAAVLVAHGLHYYVIFYYEKWNLHSLAIKIGTRVPMFVHNPVSITKAGTKIVHN